MTKTRIVTHDGGFHSDDVFGVATLVELLGEENVEIIRSRDPEVVAGGDYILDVGLINDADRNRFDHHQRGGAGVRENGVPYASFGLIWKKFGATLAGSSEVANAVDKDLVQPIDAFDNGVDLYTLNSYDVDPFTIQKVFFAFEVAWGESSTHDATFMRAVEFARPLLKRVILHEQQNEKARVIVERAYQEASDKQIICIESQPAITRTIIVDVLSHHREPLYAIRNHESSNVWQAVCVVDDIRAFKTRKDFPAAWAGKSGEALAALTGVPDAIFCHNKLFMAVAGSKEGALALAKLALEA